jgi:hypothetical protein
MIGVILLTIDSSKKSNKLIYNIKVNNINWKYIK